MAKVFILFLFCIFILIPSFAVSDEVSYIYDNTGRLIKVIKDTQSFTYSYDEVGNLLSITDGTISNTPPALQGITPDTIFAGVTTSVIIQGQNLFSTQEVISDNPSIHIKTVHVTDTQIDTEMTVSTDASLGTANITVVTSYGSAGIHIDILKLTVIPRTAYLPVGGIQQITVSLTPAKSMNLNVLNRNPEIITSPQTIQIPAEGRASFTVQSLALGTGILEVEKSTATIFVAAPFTGYASIGSHPVCVVWPWIGSAFMESKPLNVQWWGIDNAIIQSRPLCVMISQ